MSVSEAQQRISASEFAEWMAFYQIEPFGEDRHDLRHGILCSVIAGLFASKGNAPKPEDFIPRFDEERGSDKVANPDALKMVLHSMKVLPSGSWQQT